MLTDLDDEAIANIAMAFAFEPLLSVVEIVDAHAGQTFLFRMAQSEALVSLFEPELIPFNPEQSYSMMERLCRKGYPCPRPIGGRTGQWLVPAAGKLMSAVTSLPGIAARSVRPEHSFDLGMRLAQFHSLLPSLPRPAFHPFPCGHLHGAMRPGEIFFLDNRVSGILNFREVRTGSFIRELAEIISLWAMGDDGRLEVDNAQALLDGYCTARIITLLEFEALPAFIFAAAGELFAVRDRSKLPSAAEQAMNGASTLQMPRFRDSGAA